MSKRFNTAILNIAKHQYHEQFKVPNNMTPGTEQVDLGLIQQKVNDGIYKSTFEFIMDLRYYSQNVQTYHKAVQKDEIQQ